MPNRSLMLQATYAELMDRCSQAAFTDSIDGDGAFTPKTVKGRRYWYFQSSSKDGRVQKYVGPDPPPICSNALKSIDGIEKMSVSGGRSFRRSPIPLQCLNRRTRSAGLSLRSRSRAYSDCAASLWEPWRTRRMRRFFGTPLPATALQTGDIDIAQFKNVSVAIKDPTEPMLDILKQTDASFRAVPTMHRGMVVTYRTKAGLRADFLTPNEGRDTDRPQRLPALQTDAQALRFLDFLIHDPQPAVLLHGPGILVSVPAPERFAVHKLIVSRRRKVDPAKGDKDVLQADALIAKLAERRAQDLRDAWQEAYRRGPEWRRLLLESVTRLTADVRKSLSHCIDMDLEA